MTSYLDLYILINLFCTVLVLTFSLHSRAGMGNMVPQRRFATAMYVLAVFFLSDTIWFAMDCGYLPQVWWASMLLKTVYFLSATIAGYTWFLYMASLTRPAWLDSKRNRRLAGILVWLHLALCVVNLFEPILFGIDQDFVYFRGPLFGLQYLFIYVYPIVASAHALYKASRPENYIDRTRYIIISIFPLLPAISGILQLFFWRVPFNCMAFTLGVVIVYLTELSQQVSQEPLTQLANRKQFMRVLEQAMEQHRSDGQLYLFMMDVDHFKAINDTFGHAEGDSAIVAVSEALRQAVRGLRQRATLARYGGDEFAIIAYFDDPKDVQVLEDLIAHEIGQQNERSDRGYDLHLSVGVARYTSDMRTMRDLIDAADAQLYQHKR